MNSDEGTSFPFEGWMPAGLCRGCDPGLFFPEKERATDNVYTEARKICHQCPVEAECGDYAIRFNIKHGMWGGLSPRERRIARKRQQVTTRK